MTRRIYSLVLVAMASGAIVAGCGSSSTPTAPAKTSTPKTTTPKTTTPKTTTPSTTPSTGLPSSVSSAELKAAAAGCKSAEAHDTALNSAAKGYLATICSDLESGNVSAFKTDAKNYCDAVLSSVPASEKALAQTECNNIGKL